MRKAKFGSLSLEDLQEEVIGEGEGEGEENSNVEVMEIFQPEEIEVSSPDAEVIEDAVSEVEEVGEGLEALKEALTVSLADGGMNAQSAMFASLAYGNLTGKWVPASTDMPSMESFDSAGGRLQGTTYALEKLGETLKAWWEKLKAMVAKWVDAVIAFWQKHLAAAGKLERAAKALAKTARENTSKLETKEKELELDKKEVENLTSTHGQKVSESEIISGLENLVKETIRIGKDDGITKAVEKFGARFAEAKFDDASAAAQIFTLDLHGAITSIESTIGGKTGNFAGKESNDAVKLVGTPPMLGNRILLARVVGDENNQVVSIGVELVAADAKAKHEGQKVAALDKAQVIALATAVADVAGKISAAKTDGNKRRTAINAIKGDFDKVAKDLDKSDWSSKHTAQYNKYKARINAYSTMAMSVLKPYSAMQDQTMASARAALNYAAKSYKNLEAK